MTKVSPLAGKPAPASLLVNVPRLVSAYYSEQPDPSVAAERVAFGTSGHRGSAFDRTFNEAHILAIAQAVCAYRQTQKIDGPLFIGMDTHALSEPAFISALEVLAANGVAVMIDRERGYTPTPVVSHAILRYNRGRTAGLADGIVITPSHNPPEDGGFKYDPPTGGPADTDATGWIERTANGYMADGLRAVRRLPYARALKAAGTQLHDYMTPYVDALGSVVDMDAIRGSGVRIGVDPLGGAGVRYWEPIIAKYGIAATVVNDAVDPTFRFMTVDWDGKIRTDCSSPYAMVPLVALRDRFDVAFANDADQDRHGIVTPSGGLMNPNQYLATAVSYLFAHRPA
jgi:phosphoglucomutase